MAFGQHYSVSVKTCVPADPASKGGTEAAVRIAKADLLPEYDTFADLIEACAVFCEKVNQRQHRVTRRVPAEMLAEEGRPVAPGADAAAHGHVGRHPPGPRSIPMITVDGAQYSVPHALLGERCGCAYREARTGRKVVVVHLGPVEVARHLVTTPGNPRVADEHFRPPPPGAHECTAGRQTPERPGFLKSRARLFERRCGTGGCV